MKALRGNAVQKLFASTLVAVLLLGQIFSCCLVNQKLGQFVFTTFSDITSIDKKANVSSPLHECCAKRVASAREVTNGNTQDQVKHKDCCIQDANLRLPQIASEPISAPPLLAIIIGNIPVTPFTMLDAPTIPHLQFSSGPPLYITQLRFLV